MAGPVRLTAATLLAWGCLFSATWAAPIATGDIVIADVNGAFGGPGTGYGRIIKVDPKTGAQTVISSGGHLRAPVGIHMDGAGNLIVLDAPGGGSSTAVIRVDPASGAQQVVSSGGLLSGAARDVRVDAAGNVFVSDASLNGSGGIIKIDPATGAQSVVSSGGKFQGAGSLTFNAAGNILVNTGPNLVVLEVDPVTGAQIVVFPYPNPAWTSGIVAADTGEVYVSEIYYNNGVIKIASGAYSFLASGYPFQDPWGLEFDLAGNLIVADGNWWWEGRVIGVNTTTGATTVISSGNLLVDPWDVVVYQEATHGLPEPSSLLVWSLLAGLVICLRAACSVANLRR